MGKVVRALVVTPARPRPVARSERAFASSSRYLQKETCLARLRGHQAALNQ